MSDDFKAAKTTLAKLHQDMEAATYRLTKASNLSMIKQLDRTMENIHLRDLAISHANQMSGAADRIKEIFGAKQHLHEVIKQATATSRISERFTALHQSWLERVKSIQPDSSLLQLCAKLALCDVSLQLTATERLMTGINFEALRSRYQIVMPDISGLNNSIDSALASYGSLAASMRKISDVTGLPTFILPGATREIYTTGYALETLRPWDERDEEEGETEMELVAEAEQETSGCIALLQMVDPELARPYIGARDALNGNNADRARHILSSLRELWSHLLRRLAPNNLVLPWIPNQNQKDLLHKGKPTRKARVLYICRELNNAPLTDFLMQDTQVLVDLIILFNRVHKLETDLTDEHLRAIFLKSDSWLMYILQISEGNFHK